jgi:hypothetical protein
MARFSRDRRTPLWMLALLLSLPLYAQSPESPSAPSSPDEGGYGGDTFVTIIGGSEFQPLSDDVSVGYLINNGTRYPLAGPDGAAILGASLNGRIPEGAIVDQMCVYGVDSTGAAGEDLAVYFRRNHVDSGTGLDATFGTPSFVSSIGGGGDFALCDALSARIQSRWDIDNDGQIEIVDHNLTVDFGDDRDVFGGSLRIRAVRLRWQRQVSAAPAQATFNDVPTGHPYFAFVEALVASGITAGCGGGNFCVNSPITRGEMAVFLAAALGLHWPAF